ncbi:MAG: replication-associated recombination protein A, partial [Oscillospiraceae bacterium]|nr:replication-associated recombination protein A [Oscillospiraceae bacterium]
MYRPLADEIRPKTLDEVYGQEHILGKNGFLRRLIDSGQIPNMVFYGPSGCGKTTVANIIAQTSGRVLHKLNATTAGIADIKNIISDLDTMLAPNGVLLYLDEIQYFNKKQQQSLLEYLENGKITMIASTTENPYFYVYNAILSRCTVFEFKELTAKDVIKAVRRAFDILSQKRQMTIRCEDGVMEHIASACGGDVRKAVNAAELLVTAAPEEDGELIVTLDDAKTVSQKSAMRYDRASDSHYDIISALQKSIRGSDPDAGLHYLARLVEAGDLPIICRRLLVIAAEDVGLAYPQAIPIVKACVDSAIQLGFPEAQIPLADAVILLATAPKSNSGCMGIE